MLVDPEYWKLTVAESATLLEVDPCTVWRWRKKIDWTKILDARRNKYSQITPEIDDALVKKAKTGDTKAIDLYFQRFDGWVPTHKTIAIEEAKDDELKQRAAQIKAEYVAVGSRAGQDLSRAGEARA